MKLAKWMGASLMAAATMAGPLGPMTTMAQTPGQPAVPPRASQSPPPAMQPMQPEAPEVVHEPVGTGAKVGAGVLNVVYVPGKAILCGAGAIVAGGLMLLTFGNAYREATSFFNEGCSGPWTVTPEQVATAPKSSQLEY